LAVERVDDASAPTGDTANIDLASETKDLLGISLVPEITVQSVPDATSSPSVNQEVPYVSHPVPFRFRIDPPSGPGSVDAFIKAHPNPPGYQTPRTD
jgi:hypothetical protein